DDCAGDEILSGGECAVLECGRVHIADNHVCRPRTQAECDNAQGLFYASPAGVCVALLAGNCASDEIVRNGRCVGLICSPGEIADEHACRRRTQSECAAINWLYLDGDCRRQRSGECATNQALVSGICTALICAPDQIARNHKCRARSKLECTGPTLAYDYRGDKCRVASCSDNEEYFRGACRALYCAPHKIIENHKCRRRTALECQSVVGYEYRGGKCRELNCAVGEIKSGSVCSERTAEQCVSAKLFYDHGAQDCRAPADNSECAPNQRAIGGKCKYFSCSNAQVADNHACRDRTALECTSAGYTYANGRCNTDLITDESACAVGKQLRDGKCRSFSCDSLHIKEAHRCRPRTESECVFYSVVWDGEAGECRRKTRTECDAEGGIYGNSLCNVAFPRECGAGEIYDIYINACRGILETDCTEQEVFRNNACEPLECAPGEIGVNHACVSLTDKEYLDKWNRFDNSRSSTFSEINALYAYQRGYHGQGVTVIVADEIGVTYIIDAPNIKSRAHLLQNIVKEVPDALKGVSVDMDVWESHSDRTYIYSRYGNFRGYPDEGIDVLRDIYEPGSFYYLAYYGFGRAAVIALPRSGRVGGTSIERWVGRQHGVAPEAKVFPVELRDSWLLGQAAGQSEDGMIIVHSPSNNSYADFLHTPHDFRYFDVPRTIDEIIGNEGFAERAKAYQPAQDSDSIFVWSAGREGRNGRNKPVSPQGSGYVPHLYSELEDNWLVVSAYQYKFPADHYSDGSSPMIPWWDNGCGIAKMWCVSAPGYSSGDTSLVAAGALAVLKSAAPALPNTAIRAILLTTARDIGEEGIDELFGWGAIDISAGIVHIENLETAEVQDLPALRLQEFQSGLPDGFRHLGANMQHISVAVKITDDSFVNVPLASLMPQGENSAPELGDAADGMFSETATAEWRPGFAGFADAVAGKYSLGWNSESGKTQLGGEISHFAEDDTFSGLGALGAANAKQHGGKIRIKRGFSAGISAFGEYEYSEIRAEAESGKFVSGIRGAKKDGWTAGLEYANIFRHADRIQLKARQRGRFRDGNLVLQYPEAGGDFYSSFIGESGQSVVLRESEVSLREKPSLTWSLGYAAKLGESEWALAAEYDNKSRNGAISAKWRVDF
ncbi:MAG: S8 family serine peptidase, partial [Gammaproteobacteria bacterium]